MHQIDKEQHIFAFSLNIECTTEKVLQLILLLKTIYNKNLSFIEQKCIFEHYREVQSIKNRIDIIFFTKHFYGDLFRAALIGFC
jgi:hypothetical protein